ncbi:MAG: DsbC family protein [Gammaproteobacteria bacterium]|nr:DsbC family protein [Gammaproteobacteria bacterium]
MKNTVKALLVSVLMLFSVAIQAAEDQHAALKKMISKTFPGVEVSAFKESVIPNVLEFNMGAQVLYVTKDGRHLFQGNIYDLVSQKNITEESEKMARKATLDEFGEKNTLVYKAKKQKHFITVFTDIDCPYCRKLHDEVEQYLDQNISVRYMFLPFKGQKSLEKSVSVWCAKNPQQAMTEAKKGKQITSASCDNPIQKHMQLGREFGIRGTPAIVLDSGEMVPGYRPAKDVIKMLNAK